MDRMSGCSDTSRCPICGGEMETSRSDGVASPSQVCLHCGFECCTRTRMMPTEEREARKRVAGKAEVWLPLSKEDRLKYLAAFTALYGELTPEQVDRYLGKPVAQPVRRVRVIVRGGVAYVEDCPPDVQVQIVDYDEAAA